MDVKLVGPAFVTGRADNQKAEICPVCSLGVTSGQVSGKEKGKKEKNGENETKEEKSEKQRMDLAFISFLLLLRSFSIFVQP
jgi:hypothetical protein